MSAERTIHLPAHHVRRASGPAAFLHRGALNDHWTVIAVLLAYLIASNVLVGVVAAAAWCLTMIASDSTPIDFEVAFPRMRGRQEAPAAMDR